MKNKAIGLAVFMLILTAGCIEMQRNVSTRERVITGYNPYDEMLHPDLLIYHESEEQSRLYNRIKVNEFMFNRANRKDRYEAKMRIHYRIYDSPSEKKPRLENNATITLDSMHRNTYLTSYLKVKEPLNGKYFMEVKVEDMLQGASVTKELIFDKSSEFNASNYLLVYADNQRPLFLNVVDKNEKIYLRYRGKTPDKIFISYFSETVPIAPPPFSKSNAGLLSLENQDTKKIKNLQKDPFSLEKEGVYFIRVDTAANKGVPVYNFGEHYPRIETPSQMLGPLRYLLSTQEYRKLKSRKNLKLAIDNFWLGLTSSMKDARQLIKIYYTRVTFANLYFTSLTQGWKTDRGMIYTVFGPPHMVKKGFEYEKWVYGDRQGLDNVSFHFRKIDTPLSPNHYVLERKIAFEKFWSKAVETWRKGKVYSY